jgi:hypothetical protein
VVQRAEPEGVEIKSTKSGRTRRVPIADRVLPLVRAMAADRDARCPVVRDGVRPPAARQGLQADSRLDHHCRGPTHPRSGHTAACLWLARGVDPATVQAWMGHASIATTNLICTTSEPLLMGLVWSAERPGAQGGHTRARSRRITNMKVARAPSIAPSQRRNEESGAKGTRTPDLLVANETRYRLRHSPADRLGRSASRLYHRQAEADLRVSSPPDALKESDAELGASAVTGPSCRAVDATPGPDKSMVRTVRGASGLET